MRICLHRHVFYVARIEKSQLSPVSLERPVLVEVHQHTHRGVRGRDTQARTDALTTAVLLRRESCGGLLAR